MSLRVLFALGAAIAGLAAFVACSSDDHPSAPNGGADGGAGSDAATTGDDATALGGDGAAPSTDCPSGRVAFFLPNDGGAGSAVGGLAILGDTVYFTLDDGSVWKLPRCATAGMAPTLVGNAGARPNAANTLPVIAVDTTNAYVASNDGPVSALPLTGGAPTTLAAEEHVNAIRSDGAHVYYSQIDFQPTYASHVIAVPVDGGPPATIATSALGDSPIEGIAIDDQHVYYADNGDPGEGDGNVYVTQLDGGTATPLTPKPVGSPHGMTLVGSDLYVCDQAGTVYRIPTGGGPAAIVGGGINNAQFVAVTGTDIYYSNVLDNDSWVYDEPLTGPAGNPSTPPIVFHGRGSYGSIGGLVSAGSSVYFTFNGTAYADDAGADGGAGVMLVRITP